MRRSETASVRTALQGLAASGWHTAAIAMRLVVEIRLCGPHPLLGAGVDDLRRFAPVGPGDVLRLEGVVIDLVPSKTKLQGPVRIKWIAFNQCGEQVYTFTPISVVPRLHLNNLICLPDYTDLTGHGART